MYKAALSFLGFLLVLFLCCLDDAPLLYESIGGVALLIILGLMIRDDVTYRR